jgi:hypothetical protein
MLKGLRIVKIKRFIEDKKVTVHRIHKLEYLKINVLQFLDMPACKYC